MLNLPSSFPHDWYGYITNQSGHFLIGLFLCFILPYRIIVVGYIVWEVYSGWYGWDSLEDTAFVILGVVFFKYSRKYAIVACMMLMAFGVFKRGRK